MLVTKQSPTQERARCVNCGARRYKSDMLQVYIPLTKEKVWCCVNHVAKELVSMYVVEETIPEWCRGRVFELPLRKKDV